LVLITDNIVAAARTHDNMILRAFSLLIDPRDPLKTTDNFERSPSDILDDFTLSATLYARAQASLPIGLGGCDITSAELTSPSAYVGAWIDFLRFVNERPNLMPNVSALVSPASLATADIAPLRHLRNAYDSLCATLHTAGADGAAMLHMLLGAEVTGPSELRHAPPKSQHLLSSAVHAALSRTLTDTANSSPLAGYDFTHADTVRIKSCSGDGSAWLRVIPSHPRSRLTNHEMRNALAFRLHVPLAMLQRGPESCTCHQAHDDRVAKAKARRRRGVSLRCRRRKRPKRVDGYGEHDQVCPYANKLGRHNRVQGCVVGLLQDNHVWVRRTTVQELRTSNDDKSMKQADLAVELYGPEAITALLDIVVTHPTTASHCDTYGHSGDASNDSAARKHYKYDPIIDQHHLNFRLIPCAIETYGALGTEFTKMIKTIAGTIDKSSDEFRPWHARTFQQEAYQRIGIALQRGIISDQIARAHARRMRRESASGILLSETEPLFEGLGQ
jgi:hypothetical protein